MAGSALIAIAASAGGIEPLRSVVRTLPTDIDATVLVVVHLAPESHSVLPEILSRATDLPVVPAQDGAPLIPGTVVVARPDMHLLVEDGRVALGRGPRENGHRPAGDPLMRSIAEHADGRACGVVLSGNRDDGTIGLAEIKRRGGSTIVQDPDEALYPGMPRNALESVAIDAVLCADQIGAALTAFASNGAVPGAEHEPPSIPDLVNGSLVREIVCPECGGVMREDAAGGAVRFSCHAGHQYGAASLAAEQELAVERALWTAVRALEDRSITLTRLAEHAETRGQQRSATNFRDQADQAQQDSETIRSAILHFEPEATPETAG